MFFCFLCSFSSRWNVNEQFRIFSFSNNWQVLRRNSRRAWCSRQDDPLCFHLHFLPSISHYCCFYWDDEGAPFRSNQKCHFLPLVKWEILNTPRKKDLFHVECLKNVAIKLLPQLFLSNSVTPYVIPQYALFFGNISTLITFYLLEGQVSKNGPKVLSKPVCLQLRFFAVLRSVSR